MSNVRSFRTACVAAAAVSLVSVGGTNAATVLSLGGANTGTVNLGSASQPYDPVVDASLVTLLSNEGIGNGTQLTLYSGALNSGGLFASTDPSALKITYIGHEAGFTDKVTLTYNNNTIFNNQATLSGAVVLANVPINGPPGPLPFKFTVTNNGTQNAVNGGAIDAGLQIGIHLVSNVVAYVFLDDGGGSPGVDSDFDDVVFRVAVTCGPNGQECAPATTPLPAALPLFVSGLGALGFFSWRRKRRTAVDVPA